MKIASAQGMFIHQVLSHENIQSFLFGLQEKHRNILKDKIVNILNLRIYENDFS